MTTVGKTPTRTIDATPRYDGFSLHLERRFAHPRERVFAAWTDPAALAQWMGPEGFSCPDAEADARVGGAYRFPMQAPSGSTHTVYGTYTEVDPPARLVFTWAWVVEEGDPGGYEMRVTLTFDEDGDGTLLTIRHEGLASERARDDHNGGWTGGLNCLDGYLLRTT